MNILVGTSGWSYKQWKGSFYPADLSADDMLSHYAGRLPTVEINNSFYRIPKEKVLLDWAEQVPPTSGSSSRPLAGSPTSTGSPTPTTRSSTSSAPSTVSATGWGRRCSSAPLASQEHGAAPRLPRPGSTHLARGDGVPARLLVRRGGVRGAAGATTWRSSAWTRTRRRAPVVPTASWGYLRLRKTEYGEDELRAWAERVGAQPWREAYVFLKHDEDSAAGPDAAVRLAGIVAQKELSP